MVIPSVIIPTTITFFTGMYNLKILINIIEYSTCSSLLILRLRSFMIYYSFEIKFLALLERDTIKRLVIIFLFQLRDSFIPSLSYFSPKKTIWGREGRRGLDEDDLRTDRKTVGRPSAISRHKEKPVSSRRKPSLRSEIPGDASSVSLNDGICENGASRVCLTRAIIIAHPRPSYTERLSRIFTMETH